jgi:hypothetical protein
MEINLLDEQIYAEISEAKSGGRGTVASLPPKKLMIWKNHFFRRI